MSAEKVNKNIIRKGSLFYHINLKTYHICISVEKKPTYNPYTLYRIYNITDRQINTYYFNIKNMRHIGFHILVY